MSRTTSKIIGAALIVVTLGGGAALAQGTPGPQGACRPDVDQIVACLRGNGARLSDACRHVMFSEQAMPEGYAARSRVRSNVEWRRPSDRMPKTTSN
jgi:hypothetical protein